MRAPGQDLCLLEAPIAERDGGAVVLSHVDEEWLSSLLGDLVQRGDLSSRRIEIAEGDEGRHAPGHRLDADLGVAQIVGDVPGLREHVEDLLDRGGPARPVRAHQDGGEPGAIPQPPGHRDRGPPDDRPALAVALEVERPSEAAEQPDTQLGVLFAERRGRLLQELDRALVVHSRAPAGVFVAGRRSS